MNNSLPIYNKKDELGMVAHRKNRRPWLVTMTFEEWIEIYKGYLENKSH